MSKKRLCPFDEASQAVKKQELKTGLKVREITSVASEKTLQLLYKGSKKQFQPIPKLEMINIAFHCCNCSVSIETETKCYYCEKSSCLDCLQDCIDCKNTFCKNCSFSLNDEDYLRYTCY